MSRITLRGVLIATLALALVACSQTTPTPTPTLPPSSTPTPAFTLDPAPESSQLTEEIPPCTPAPDSGVDPCEPLTDTFGIPGPPGHVFWLGNEPPRDMQYFLTGTSKIDVPHVVVRGTYLPDTVRCTTGNLFQPPAYVNQNNLRDITFIYCYADVRVNAYVLGSGPSELTVLVYWYIRRGPGEEKVRLSLESVLSRGNPDRMIQGIIGREAMLFIGPSADASIEAWQVMSTWDVQRMPDDTVVAVHPLRKEWEELRDDWEQYLSQLEVTLPSFGTAVTTAHQERVAANGGRTRPDPTFPMLVTDANNLRDYFVEVGAYDDPDNPPAQPPPPCGLAVPDQTNNPGLMADCFALLAAKDALRGTASLNWSMERPIRQWDGVTTGRTPLRVVRLELPNKGLSGSMPPELGALSGLRRLDLSRNALTGDIPPELGNLSNLLFIRLAGNSLTGCIPAELRSVGDNDLDSIAPLYCPVDCVIHMGKVGSSREQISTPDQRWDSTCYAERFPSENAMYYAFTLEQGMRVRVSGYSDATTLYLTLRRDHGKTGTPVRSIVRTGVSTSAEAPLAFVERLSAGHYTVVVRTPSAGNTGFNLKVEAPAP